MSESVTFWHGPEKEYHASVQQDKVLDASWNENTKQLQIMFVGGINKTYENVDYQLHWF